MTIRKKPPRFTIMLTAHILESLNTHDISTNFECYAAIRLTDVCLCADNKYRNVSLFTFDPLP